MDRQQGTPSTPPPPMTPAQPATLASPASPAAARQQPRRRTRRNKAPARWAVVAAGALMFGAFWDAISPDPITALTASSAEAAVSTVAAADVSASTAALT